MFGGILHRLFAIRCLVKTYPARFLSILLLTSTLLYAFMLKVIEGPLILINKDSKRYLNDFSSLENCVWFTLITMSTGSSYITNNQLVLEITILKQI